MQCRLADNKDAWNAWEIAFGGAEFLQSWEWGDFQRSVGRPVSRWVLEDRGATVAQVQVIQQSLGLFGHYGYAPRVKIAPELWEQLLPHLTAGNELFLAVEPLVAMEEGVLQSRPVAHRQPRATMVVTLDRSPQEILAAMHQKTRYNIHVATRKGVLVREEKNVAIFWQLLQETTTRDKFRGHTRDYYEKMLASPFTHQLTAYLGDQPIASTISVIFGSRFTYLHGASGNTARDSMAPYLLQWEGMKLAQASQCHEYDFWGVAPPAPVGTTSQTFHLYTWAADHPFSGITRFKAGFGGMLREYPAAYDIVFRPAPYQLYSLTKQIRKIFV